MAYVVLYYKDQEVDRRKLDRAVVIGRSPECDVAIRDVLLSRRHCRIEKEGRDWVLSDLGSKNGTRVGGSAITRHVLRDADVIRAGKSTIRFHRGAFVPAPKTSAPAGRPPRPADPFEALSGTVTAFEFEPRGPVRNTERLPTPRPGPPEPAAYDREDVRSMVSGLVSSSWDSIYDNARRPDPTAPQSPLIENLRRKRACEPRVDASLQLGPHGASRAATEQAPALLDPPAPRGRIWAWLRRLAKLFQ